jgi:hypothetical protein
LLREAEMQPDEPAIMRQFPALASPKDPRLDQGQS